MTVPHNSTANSPRWTRTSMDDLSPTSPESVARKVRALLNKLVPSNLETIWSHLIALASGDGPDNFACVVVVAVRAVFEHAMEDERWAAVYALLYRKIAETIREMYTAAAQRSSSRSLVNTHKALADSLEARCADEFALWWARAQSGAGELAAPVFSDEYYYFQAGRRRSFGTLRFAAELFKLGLIAENVVHALVEKILSVPHLAVGLQMDALYKLLSAVGEHLIKTANGRSRVDGYLARAEILELQSGVIDWRVPFVRQDLVDLHRRNWATETLQTPIPGPPAISGRTKMRSPWHRGNDPRPDQSTNWRSTK
ncbi:MIF4-like, type 1/2/3 [Mycena kentingensis (nom. inval.)]|nr:MIF4-like, type 1/2/3 [Mycena kentingensis (nom. inval.)]